MLKISGSSSKQKFVGNFGLQRRLTITVSKAQIGMVKLVAVNWQFFVSTPKKLKNCKNSVALINCILSYMRPDWFHKYSTNFHSELSWNPKIGSDSCCAGSLKAIRSSHWFSTHSMMCLVWCHGRSSCINFNCDCRKSLTSSTYPTTESRCIEFADVCDGTPDCSDMSDEADCVCSDDELQCSDCERGETGCIALFYCLPRAYVGNGRTDCLGKDEEK